MGGNRLRPPGKRSSLARGFSVASLERTASDAVSSNCSNSCGGISGRAPTHIASRSSPSERLTRIVKPLLEKFAPAFLAVLSTTCWSPRSTRTSVTASASIFRSEIASRCSWLLVLAHSIKLGSSSRSEWIRIGEATSIALSHAKMRRTLGGVLDSGPRRIANNAREDCSIVSTRRTKTSSKREISSSEY